MLLGLPAIQAAHLRPVHSPSNTSLVRFSGSVAGFLACPVPVDPGVDLASACWVTAWDLTPGARRAGLTTLLPTLLVSVTGAS